MIDWKSTRSDRFEDTAFVEAVSKSTRTCATIVPFQPSVLFKIELRKVKRVHVLLLLGTSKLQIPPERSTLRCVSETAGTSTKEVPRYFSPLFILLNSRSAAVRISFCFAFAEAAEPLRALRLPRFPFPSFDLLPWVRGGG